MNLSQKYWFLLGSFGVAALVSVGLLTLILIIFPPSTVYISFFYVLLGVLASLAALSAYRLLFSAEEIEGHRGKYRITADLSSFEVIGEKITSEPRPEQGICAECGKTIFNPFRCEACGKLLCGVHILAGEHRCVVPSGDFPQRNKGDFASKIEVQCSKCQKKNPRNAQFCIYCGKSLVINKTEI